MKLTDKTLAQGYVDAVAAKLCENKEIITEIQLPGYSQPVRITRGYGHSMSPYCHCTITFPVGLCTVKGCQYCERGDAPTAKCDAAGTTYAEAFALALRKAYGVVNDTIAR